jgi:type II secretory ATPase GspE/PulE/Tfp pilus assembly ATPase PilB-like protein
VLTSLHAHSAAAAVGRLRDMGVPGAMIANAVNAIVAQRLARRLCVECREAYTAEGTDRALLGVDETADPLSLWRANGCSRCRRTGFRGRVAVYEVMPIDGPMRMLLDASTEEIYAHARAQGMRTLREDGYRLCLEGICSLEEIHRVIGDRVH